MHQPEIPLNAGIFMRHTFQKKKFQAWIIRGLRKGIYFLLKQFSLAVVARATTISKTLTFPILIFEIHLSYVNIKDKLYFEYWSLGHANWYEEFPFQNVQD